MSTSAISACVDKYLTLTAVPDLYFGDAPPADGATQIYPPYVVLLDSGLTPEYEFDLHQVLEVTEVGFMVYGNQLSDVDATVQKIKYNGQPPSSRAGFDFGSLPSLTGGYERMEVRRTSERRFVASIQGTGKQGQRVHGCELRYRVSIFYYGT